MGTQLWDQCGISFAVTRSATDRARVETPPLMLRLAIMIRRARPEPNERASRQRWNRAVAPLGQGSRSSQMCIWRCSSSPTTAHATVLSRDLRQWEKVPRHSKARTRKSATPMPPMDRHSSFIVFCCSRRLSFYRRLRFIHRHGDRTRRQADA